jgi:hypothetical protein
MARLVPRVGKEQPDLIDRSGRYQILHRGHGIRLDNSHIVEAVSDKLSEHPRDRRLIDLERQEVGTWPSFDHRNERVAGARTDLHDELCIAPEHLREIQRRGRVD